MIKGGALKKTLIYTDVVAPGNGVATKHEIRMTEVRLQESARESREAD